MASEAGTDHIKAFDALHLLQAANGGPVATKAMLADLLRDGGLRGYAERLWESEATTVTRAWREIPQGTEVQANQEVEPKVWRYSKNWSSDMADWRWPQNRFVITRRQKPVRRVMIEGLSFASADIDRLPSVVGAAKPPGRGGRPKKDEAWASFWMELIDIAKNGRLSEHSFQSQAELRRELLDSIDEALSEGSIKPRVSQVWKRFVEPDSQT